MTTQQILMWVNALLKPFSIRVKAMNKNGDGYKLEVLNDVLGIVKRRNKRDRFYEDEANLLKQEARDGDPFIDEETGKTLIVRREEERVEKRRRVAEELDTSKLDVGINFDDDDESDCRGTVLAVAPVAPPPPLKAERVRASRFVPDHDW